MVTCSKPGCTVAETGICLLSHLDLNTCSFFSATENLEEVPQPAEPVLEAIDPILRPSAAGRRFPLGLELGTEDAAEIMRARYAHLVGVLGSWDAGKTCFLLSLYLMASRGALPPGYLFAGSQTLQGFEERARHLRKWRGGRLPEQLADHTSLADPRQPSLLHIALRKTDGDRRLFDVMLTDLPGEWSKSLIERATTADRFSFLRRADGIILVVDGTTLQSSKSRHAELKRSQLLLERLVQAVGVEASTPLVLLVSKYDLLDGKRPEAVGDLEGHAKSLGFSPEVVLCAAFSRTPQTVDNGMGVVEALEKILIHDPPPLQASPAYPRADAGGRAFFRFGRPLS